MTVHREKAPNGIEESENTLSLVPPTATTTVQTGPQGFHPSGTPPDLGRLHLPQAAAPGQTDAQGEGTGAA